MELLLGKITDSLGIFILVFVRMTGLFLISSVFGRRNVPSYMKVGFSLLLSFIVLSSSIISVGIDLFESWFELAYCIVKELFVGFIMGFITNLTFSAIWTAGQILDTQIGFGIINAIDPQNNIQIPLMANFQNMLALLIFFAIDGHHKLIQIIFNSYNVIPLGTGTLTENISVGMIKLFADSFLFSVKLTIAVIGASLLSMIAFGVLARAVPQINVFIVEIPFKIFIGLVVLLVSIPIIVEGFNDIFSNMFHNISTIIWELTPK